MNIPTYFAKALLEADKIGVNKTTEAGVKGALNTVYFWAGVVAVIGIVIAAFLYVTSNGNPAQATQARNAIIGALVGLVIVFSAFVITNTVIGGF